MTTGAHLNLPLYRRVDAAQGRSAYGRRIYYNARRKFDVREFGLLACKLAKATAAEVGTFVLARIQAIVKKWVVMS